MTTNLCLVYPWATVLIFISNRDCLAGSKSWKSSNRHAEEAEILYLTNGSSQVSWSWQQQQQTLVLSGDLFFIPPPSPRPAIPEQIYGRKADSNSLGAAESL